MAVEWPGFLCLFLEEDRVSAPFGLVKKSGCVLPWESEKAKATKPNKQTNKDYCFCPVSNWEPLAVKPAWNHYSKKTLQNTSFRPFTIQDKHCVPAKVPPRSYRSTLRERIARNATKLEIKTMEKGRRDPGLGKEEETCHWRHSEGENPAEGEAQV